MNCKSCGAEIAETEKFCPNCGAAAATETQTEAAAAPTPAPAPTPTPTPEQPPKKRKVGKIILIVVIIVVVLLLAAAGGAYAYIRSIMNRGEENVETYWNNYTSADTAAMTEQIPDAYWDYISENYGYTKDDCIAGLDYFYAAQSELLGDHITCTYDAADPVVGTTGMTDSMAEINEAVAQYGLSYTWCVSVALSNITVSGDSDSYELEEVGVCLIKIDGEWYDLTVMDDIDNICSGGYVEAAQYQTLYGDTIQTYWTSFYNNDTDTMASMMPDALWTLLSENYGVDEEGAKECMSQYITDLKEYSSMTGTTFGFDISVTSDEDYDIENMEDMNTYLGEALTADVYMTVNFDYSLSMDDEVLESDASSSIMMQLDDTWYLFDGIYYFIDACYYYAAS